MLPLVSVTLLGASVSAEPTSNENRHCDEAFSALHADRMKRLWTGALAALSQVHVVITYRCN